MEGDHLKQISKTSNCKNDVSQDFNEKIFLFPIMNVFYFMYTLCFCVFYRIRIFVYSTEYEFWHLSKKNYPLLNSDYNYSINGILETILKPFFCNVQKKNVFFYILSQLHTNLKKRKYIIKSFLNYVIKCSLFN